MPPGNGMISVSMASVICRIRLFLSAMALFRAARIACWSGASSNVGELWQYFLPYVNHMPPHVKYILLEKSEDLVFDIIDHLTELLDRRQYRFSQNGWSKLTEVPPEENMPAVFVIIDEFAQMSQILKETKGAGYGLDYTIKLENLLAKGRALGLKFIFASQTYTTGISGLTETACKQIQMRFALKNTPDEIKQTLNLSSDQITPELSRTIASMPAYQTMPA